MSLTGQEVNGLNQSELKAQCEQFLDAKMHGICFSPYEGTQEPGDPISEAQVRRKLELLVPHAQWIGCFRVRKAMKSFRNSRKSMASRP